MILKVVDRVILKVVDPFSLEKMQNIAEQTGCVQRSGHPAHKLRPYSISSLSNSRIRESVAWVVKRTLGGSVFDAEISW